MINYNDIKSLQHKTIYPTSNEKYVLTKHAEKIIRSPEYKILGFLHNFCFSYENRYIAKSTLNGVIISEVYVGEIDHASFNENVDFFYIYKDKKFYKIDENLNIEWEESTDDYIKSITVDTNGLVYIVYKNSRIIHEYLPDKTRLRSFRDSDDINNKTRLFKTFINKGRTEMYTIGTVFVKTDKPYTPALKDVVLITEEGKFVTDENGEPIIISVLNEQLNEDYKAEYAEAFIDKYNLITGEKESHGILCIDYGVRSTDPYYNFDNIYVEGNNIYIYSNEYVQKINKSMVNIWKYNLAYNAATRRYNQLAHIEYDDNDFKDHLYFVEDLFETNGHGFGKLDTKGNLIWKIAFDKSVENCHFSFGSYKESLFTSHKSLLNIVDSYYLAVNDYNIVFRTKDGKLINITRNNEDEIYSNEYFDSFQLLADVIRSDVQEYISKPILVRGNEPLLNEDGQPILIEEYNQNYLNPENYEVYRLKGVDVRDEPYPNGALITKQQSLILSTLKEKKILITLHPIKPPVIPEPVPFLAAIGKAGIDKAKMKLTYVPDRSQYEYPYLPGIGIACIGRAKLLRYIDIENLTYEYPFYLKADRHIFRNNIITKKKGLTIITKRTGASIIKKVKEFYKFIFRRFKDIDIVLEFVKQSGILNTTLPYFADKLIHHTTHMIRDMQEAHIPVSYDLKADKMFSFYFDGIEYPIRELRTQIYMCNNLPFIKKQETESIYIDSMTNLVNNEMIKPFIMFIDGKAIKWSNMTIVHNWEYSYIVVSDIDHDTSYKYKVDAILLPCLIRYGEDENILPVEYEKFLFDENGRYTDTPSPNGIRVEIIDPKVSGISYEYSRNTKYIEINNKFDQISSDKNILIFEDNKFYPENIDYLQQYGDNIYTYNKGIKAIIKTFYFINANGSKNHLVKIPNQDQVVEDIKNGIINKDYNSTYLPSFSNKFDYEYKRKYSYNENVSRAIEYIMEYDMSLLNRYYLDKSNIRCYCYSGKDIMERVNGKYLEMPRDRKYGLDDYVLVFKNGNLYDRYREIEYKANMFKIPVNNSLVDDDTIEIVHFKHVDNRYYTVNMTHMSEEELKELENIPGIDIAKIDYARLYEEQWYRSKQDSSGSDVYDYKKYLVNHLRHGHLTIWGNNKSGSENYDDTILPDNFIQYPINFEYKNTKDEYGNYVDTEILIEDRYYKYRNVNFASNRQFHYMNYNVNVDEQDLFDLDQTFRFCQNRKQYMIFVNGKKLNFTDWDLLIPKINKIITYTIRALSDENGNIILINDKPLEVLNTSVEESYIETNRMTIKTNIPLKLGDFIEIVYVPDPYDEIVLNKYIPNENNIIELDKNIIQYPFSKDLFLVFMNGKKVSNDLIDDINTHKIRLKTVSDDDKINMENITICKYIIPDNILKELYSYGDEWSDAVDNLSDSDFAKLFTKLKSLV